MKLIDTLKILEGKHFPPKYPFVLGPEFAMDLMPGPGCFRVKFSSSNFSPWMDLTPVPSWPVRSHHGT